VNKYNVFVALAPICSQTFDAKRMTGSWTVKLYHNILWRFDQSTPMWRRETGT